MYSSRIHDDLIPRNYWVAKRAKLPITRWVNQILERALANRRRKTPGMYGAWWRSLDKLLLVRVHPPSKLLTNNVPNCSG